LLPVWKNNSIRTFSTVFAPLIHNFLTQHPEFASLPLVPVPPRPKKLWEKGWDQIEDLAKDLAVYPALTIYRCLKRQDGIPQKKLSKADRAVNLQGKITFSAKAVPDKVMLLDDVMTTGATLEACAHVLKNAGCREVYGLCLFFD
jgi:comF-related protein